MSVLVTRHASISLIQINRPECRNAIDGPTAAALSLAFRQFDADDSLSVAVLYGGDSFCAGADLKAMAIAPARRNLLTEEGDGPLGPTRMRLSKPVIAAIAGHAVAGGLELALWCDLRVAETGSTFGVFCRRFGVPLIDGGTVRLPRLIGMSRAMDMILTGRAVSAEEAYDMGLVNRLCDRGQALAAAMQLAQEIAALPRSAYAATG